MQLVNWEVQKQEDWLSSSDVMRVPCFMKRSQLIRNVQGGTQSYLDIQKDFLL
jgi:hypothetical protein